MVLATLKGSLHAPTLESRILADNALGDPHARSLYVYTPPSAGEGERLPVVIMLPGFAGNHRSVLSYSPWKPNTLERLDAQIAAGECPPAIVALPDCMTRWGGSQFVNSPAQGDYQRYLADEVVPFLDEHFPTIAAPLGRTVVGRSSGGFGALRLAMDRPGLVGAVASHAGDVAFDVSMRPMLVSAAIGFERAGGLAAFARSVTESDDHGGLRGPRGTNGFDALIVLAMAAAYSPNMEAPFPHVDLPIDVATGELVEEVWARWMAQDPLARLERDTDAREAMRGLAMTYLDAGNRDEHGLHYGARLLRDALLDTDAKVIHEEFEAGHRGTSYRYERSLPALLGALAAARGE